MAEHFKHVDASSHTACGIALRTGSRTFVDFDTPPVGTDSCLHLQAGLHTAQATPLLSRDGSAIGMLNTHWRSAGHRSSDDELRFLDLLARQAADLIEQRRAQAALRISENRLRQFGEASQDVIWMRDAGTLQWSYLTPAFESIYGLSRTQAMAGDNYLGWMNLIVEQDRARVAECIERTRAGENVTFDYRIRRPSDGAVRWLRDTDFPILDASGHVTMIGGIGHDFTEAREAEVRLKTLVQGIPQLVWRATDPGQWTWASPQWLAYTGQSPEGSLGWGWLSALHPDDRERARSAWMQAMEKEGFEVDFRVCHAGAGEYRWFQTRATPVRSETGAIVEWLGTSTDVDELRQLQERQQVLVAELQHRTRNLMSVVQATAERTGANSEGLDDFRHRFTDRLQALARVQGLLSRLSETDRLPFDELIRSELQAVHGVDERVTLTGPAGIRLRSSMVQTLAMALHELATNAVKYGALSHGGGHLSVTWQMAEPDRNGRPRLLIEWRERGVRMPPPNSRPQGGGQGRELIEKALPYQLNAATRFQMTDDGVFCSITIPVSSSAPQAPAHG
jgi:PAS domain S-box-containing protein